MRYVCAVSVLLSVALAGSARATTPTVPTMPENPVVIDSNQFAVDFYQHVRQHDGNLFFSPTSISTVLAMAYAGAKGQTAEQMAKVLHFKEPAGQVNQEFAKLIAGWNAGSKEHNFQLDVANAMWGQKGYPFQPAFNQTLQANFGAAIRLVDFGQSQQARKTINDWVAQQTQQKIQDLMPPDSIAGDTRLVLTNAIYFKAHWDKEFHEGVTQPGEFHVTGDKTTQVPMMRQMEEFRYLKGDGFAALEMTYADNSFSMITLLPDKTDGLADFEKSLTAEKLLGWIDQMGTKSAQDVQVLFPKFKITEELKLNDTLSEMGMPLAFSGQADFSGMNGGREPLCITAAIHKAYVNVDEKGTEAAAATGIAVGRAALIAHMAQFKADHPFLFVIRDNRSGGLLFMGRIVNPNG